MYKILNRFAWFLAVIAGISIFAIDEDLFVFGIIAIFVIKFLILKESFIKSNILDYNKRLEESILRKIGNTDFKENNKEILEDEIIENINLKEQSINSYLNEKIETQEIQPQIIENKIEEIQKEPSKIAKFVSEFFAENLMAKIGGILLAIGIIFLMSLVYSVVGEVKKIIIGFAVGFIIYFIGTILHKKGFQTEGFILLGTGILINYIVILAGKFIIGDNSDGFLGSGITFGFLILNTVFSVLTSYIYNSKNLLLFSIIFAFIIPFLTGNNDKTPYLQIGYGLIISIGGLIISNYFKNKNDISSCMQLFFISLIGGNILFLTSPFGDNTNYFVIKMIAYNILTFLGIFLAYKNKLEKNILPTFIISFVFLALIMFSGAMLSSLGILICFIIGTIGLLISTSFFMIAGIGSGLLYLLFLPILYVLGFIFIGGVGSSVILLPLFLVVYLGVFAFGIGGILTSTLKYIFFSIIGIFLIIGNINLSLNLDLNMPIFIVMMITGFLFMISTYFLSSKKDLSYLYTIGTLASIFIFWPIIKITGEFTQVS
ncbi:MAG: DUF2339 domain-containing protein, partial [Candidatus Gracilibacteria bacterium]|nr:DUF2339 domain-containing protein [Candidatus Gracilibacteria bacterium]